MPGDMPKGRLATTPTMSDAMTEDRAVALTTSSTLSPAVSGGRCQCAWRGLLQGWARGQGQGGGGRRRRAAQSRAAAPPARLMVPHARTCLAQDLGVHQQDVAHGQEGDHSRLDFRAYCAPPIADFEVAAAWARPGGAHAHRPTRHGRWVAQRKPGRLDTGSNGAAGAAPDTPLACAPGLCAAGTSMLATHLSRASLSPIAPAAALRGIDLGE